MPRPKRDARANVDYHVLNRGAQRKIIFTDDSDYALFEALLTTAAARFEIALSAYCLMPTHWHLLIRSAQDGAMSLFVQWLAGVHARQWNKHRESVSRGAVYQGRFRSFAVQDDAHFVTVARYIERNALRANLVAQAEDWRWSSCALRLAGTTERRPVLGEWPVPRGSDWLARVNTPETEAELESLRASAQRGTPFGDADWRRRHGLLLGQGRQGVRHQVSDTLAPLDARDLDGRGARGDAAGS